MNKSKYDELKSELEHAYYPEKFTEDFEGLECLSASDGYETILVKDKKTGELCIAKCYSIEHPLYRQTEPDELRIIKHDRIPSFICEYKDDKSRCVVREYIKGRTLDEIAKERAFSEEEIYSIIEQILEILEKLHSNIPSIIHRDIKPQNIVISDDEKVYLIDFGISKIFTGENTNVTTVFGTRDFAPPEQYGFSETDSRSDIYSLGVLFKWLITGDVKKAPEKTSKYYKIIEKCTAFDPNDRFKTASDVKNELNRTKSSYRKKRTAIIIIITIIIALLASFLIADHVFNLREGNAIEINNPLIETAALYNLDKRFGHISKEEALDVTEIFIVADKAFKEEDEFYNGINDWYSKGQNPFGEIDSIEDLTQFPNLKKVCIVGQNISDISALNNCKDLEKVELKHNLIEDISVFKDLQNLGSIGLNNNPVYDISPLIGLENLKYLDLCDVDNYDGSTFESLGDFEYLDISNKTNSYKYLSGKTIRRLCINYSEMDSINYLLGVHGLEELEIASFVIKNTSEISDILDLTSLKKVRTTTKIKDMIKELGEVPFEIY